MGLSNAAAQTSASRLRSGRPAAVRRAGPSLMVEGRSAHAIARSNVDEVIRRREQIEGREEEGNAS
jgi:hypothetical protein